jgi:hypothetical protein
VPLLVEGLLVVLGLPLLHLRLDLVLGWRLVSLLTLRGVYVKILLILLDSAVTPGLGIKDGESRIGQRSDSLGSIGLEHTGVLLQIWNESAVLEIILLFLKLSPLLRFLDLYALFVKPVE